MPKKKNQKSSDKQDESKKTLKKYGSEFPADKSGSDRKEKELYLTQIGYLTDELERYQLKCDDLERQKKDLLSQYSTLQQENRDIVVHLETSRLKTEGEVDELLERLENQRRAADQERDTLQVQLSQQRQELQDHIEKLIKENAALAERLASLEAFQTEKEKLVSSRVSLEKQLASQKEEHKDDIHRLEMKLLLEKKRLEREMESRAAATAAEVQHLVDQRVPEMTRLVLQENAEVKARVRLLSQQVQVLMEENAALRDHKTQLSVDVENLEQMLSKMSRTSCVRKKVVEQLTEKCQQLQAEQKESRQQLKQLQTKHTGVLATMAVLRQDQASLCDQCSKNRDEVIRLEAELEQERRRRSRMKNNMQEAAVTLRQALMEEPTKQDSEADSVVQWKQLMQQMLVVLSRHGLASSTAENDDTDELWAPDHTAPQTFTPDLSFQFQLARYRPGDLGFVPRPMLKRNNMLSRVEAGCSRKPSCQQTVKLTDSAARRLTSKHSVTKLK